MSYTEGSMELPENENLERSFEDQQFIAQIETALTDDLRENEIFAEVLWHEQNINFWVFRFVIDPNLGDLESIKAVLDKPNTRSSELGITKPYMVGENLLVWVPRKTPGALYSDGTDDDRDLYDSV